MSKESRRKLLKGLAITLPAAWTTPMVESIVLPVHAETSPACDAPEDCYLIPGDLSDSSFPWPGGAGPESVNIFVGDSCSGEGTLATLVVAENLAAAQAVLECEGEFEQVVELTTEPAPGAGCAFFGCFNII